MPKLNPEHQIKPTKAELQKILEVYDLKLRKFKIAKGGIENTTFLIDTNKGGYALRVYRKNKKSIKDITLELGFMNLLHTHKLPVPQVFSNRADKFITQHKHKGVVWRCILMQLMTGKHPKSYSKSLLSNLSKIHARMHELGIGFARSFKKLPKFDTVLVEGYFASNVKLKPYTPTATREFLERIKRFRLRLPQNLPKALNHLDYNHGNIMVNKSRLSAILDFDDLSYSPIVVCLAYTLWDVLYMTRDPKAVIGYLTEYQKHRSLNKLELGILKDLLQFRNYVVGAMIMMFFGPQTARLYIKFEKIIANLQLIK